jgi:hypothetical protein
MKLRVLAAAAVAAWSKTAAATTASVLPGVLDQPAGASVIGATPQVTSCPTGPRWDGPNFAPNTGFGLPDSVVVKADLGLGFKSGDCSPGTAFLQASVDQSQWKTLDTQHATQTPQFTDQTLSPFAPCLAGTWWYRGLYVTDDHSFKGTSQVAEFKC